MWSHILTERLRPARCLQCSVVKGWSVQLFVLPAGRWRCAPGSFEPIAGGLFQHPGAPGSGCKHPLPVGMGQSPPVFLCPCSGLEFQIPGFGAVLVMLLCVGALSRVGLWQEQILGELRGENIHP